MRRARLGRALLMALASLFVLGGMDAASPHPAHADTLITDCSSVDELRAAVESGGTITFDCSDTITFDDPLRVTHDTVIDATGFDVTLDTNQLARHFIVANEAALTLIHLTLVDANGEDGGSIYTEDGTSLTLNDVEFSGNSAAHDGGAIYSRGALNITASRFFNNTAGRSGGALFTVLGQATIRTTRFVQNEASALDEEFGGGAIRAHANVDIRQSEFADNAAKSGMGHALHVTSGVVENSTISDGDRTTPAGYQIDVWGHFRIDNATLVANSGSGTVRTNAPLELKVSRSILDGTCSFDFGIVFALTNLSDGCAEITDLTGDPLLAPLADNGGLTRTHALLEDSPARDRYEEYCPTIDQRGFARPYNVKCDIGAYEFGSEPSPPQATAHVFWDQDLNGIFNENGSYAHGYPHTHDEDLAGWMVTLTQSGGAPDGKVTDGNGEAKFVLTPGDYQMCLTLQSGWFSLQPLCRTFIFDAGDGDVVLDFPAFTGAAVVVQTFHDRNVNGLKDGDDRPLGEHLFSFASGGGWDPEYTDGEGRMVFWLSPPMVLALRVQKKPGWVNTTTSLERTVEVTGPYIYEVNFGFIATNTAIGTVFVDTNENGRHDEDETTRAGMDIALKQDGVIVANKPTDEYGDAYFDGLAGLNYQLCLTVVPGYAFTTPLCSAEFDLVDPDSWRYWEFGVKPLNLVTGFVYEDSNWDGDYDESYYPPPHRDYPLQGWTVSITQNGAPVTSGVTGERGGVEFYLPNGNYQICELAPETGWIPTTPTCVDLILGGGHTVAQFGNHQGSAVVLQVFLDHNANGVRDAGEPDGSIHRYFVDMDGAELFNDETEPTGRAVVTLTPGHTYTFEAWGPYPDPFEWYQTTPLTPLSVAGSNERLYHEIGVALIPPDTADLIAVVYWDHNNSFAFDGGDDPLAGRPVSVWEPPYDFSHAAFLGTTDAQGAVSFPDTPLGEYMVCTIAGAGWLALEDVCKLVTLTLPGSETIVDFPFEALGNLYALVFHDENENGVRDDGELGLPNWWVNLNPPGGGGSMTGADGMTAMGFELNTPTNVCVQLQGGWESTTPTCVEVTFGVPDETVSLAFGVTQSAATCDNPDAKRDLVATITPLGENRYAGTVTNRSDACTYDIGMAAYGKPDGDFAHQELFSHMELGQVGPGEHTLSVEAPPCAAQIDVYFDASHLYPIYHPAQAEADAPPLTLPALDSNAYGPLGNRYGMRLLAAIHTPGQFCHEEPPVVDSDGDTIPDDEDVCPFDALHDEIGDPCNHDEDGDTLADGEDVCPFDALHDEIGDPCNHDEDGDTLADGEDVCPFDALHDEIGDPCNHDEDGDTLADGEDMCPLDAYQDEIGDPCIWDEDGDTVPDGEDVCPFDAVHDEVGDPCNHEDTDIME